MSKLKSCPFCGEIAEINVLYPPAVEIKCLGCPAKMTAKFLRVSAERIKEIMAEKWNKRDKE
jgi:hypothetical protein